MKVEMTQKEVKMKKFNVVEKIEQKCEMGKNEKNFKVKIRN